MRFEKIFFDHQKMVFNLALQYVQNFEDAEEITQDVFVKVSENLKSFKKNSSYKTWIYRIAINQSLDFIKNKNAQKRFFLNNLLRLNDETQFYEPVNFNHPGIILEQKEEIVKIFTAINQLPDQQKTVVILMKIEGNSQRETAEIMDMNEKAVESLLQRAKKNLEKILITKEGL